MCRLLGWAGSSPRTLGEVLGEPGRSTFTNLSKLHDDGWGVASVAEPAMAPTVARSTSPAFSDELLAQATSTSNAACLVHFRKASPGLVVDLANTHPFVYGTVAFAHNGSISPQARLDEIVTGPWRERLVGTTDSERYFLAVMSEVEAGRSMTEAIDTVVTRVTREFETSSLNAMFLTPEALYVVNSHDPARAPGPEMEPDGQPYYQLRVRRSADLVVVASSGFPQTDEDGWEMLRNHTLLVVDLLTVGTTTLPLGSNQFVGSHE